MAGKLNNSPDNPVSLRVVNDLVGNWIERLGTIWVEGQIGSLSMRPNWKFAYITLHDADVSETSCKVICPASVVKRAHIGEKSHVLINAQPQFFRGKGEFQLRALEIRPLGEGQLLMRLEQLRKALDAEGLFDPRLKRRLPFLPRRIGLITGRGSDAERDVISVARDRWPEVDIHVINTAVQGPKTVPQVVAALSELDNEELVDVIIIARGGGSSTEDLLPFSEETLIRAVSRAKTPVVSAIGHDRDTPILDNVADLRASTPTDAAKRVVPDVIEERRRVAECRTRANDALRRWVDKEAHMVEQLRNRPVLLNPLLPVQQRSDQLGIDWANLRRAITSLVERESATTSRLRSTVKALGPANTLARGYAVVQVQPRDKSGDQVVTSIDQAPPGSQLRIRVTDGSITAAGMSVRPAD
ncbi:exodeoxyribonuclease VII large subunit [Corynebacterium sp. TAE3-ERU12]|uniref:exodeoxyribonuclease VII large subunit n=1 Tax=Corynebacterium sp. TAE3-ERU12 TaxID=2849491 RepID=UPI001C446F87|nr:exodeoxyribonuclease VII large subunit [Corynebacterium sp. TAE3-ERU12]MBV7295718.1 exodeoxyribonuclease VII large subunit [Corynebacterium sp. TAE3-ERU12]